MDDYKVDTHDDNIRNAHAATTSLTENATLEHGIADSELGSDHEVSNLETWLEMTDYYDVQHRKRRLSSYKEYRKFVDAIRPKCEELLQPMLQHYREIPKALLARRIIMSTMTLTVLCLCLNYMIHKDEPFLSDAYHINMLDPVLVLIGLAMVIGTPHVHIRVVVKAIVAAFGLLVLFFEYQAAKEYHRQRGEGVLPSFTDGR